MDWIGGSRLTWKTSDLAEIVDDEDDACGGTGAIQAEGLLVRLHGVDGAHQGAVEAVQGGDEVADAHDGVELDHVRGQELGLLLGDGGRQGHGRGVHLVYIIRARRSLLVGD